MQVVKKFALAIAIIFGVSAGFSGIMAKSAAAGPEFDNGGCHCGR
jgi:hypothetical protein